MLDAQSYWLARLFFLRGIALISLIGFLNALNQFRPLCGEHGLMPAPLFMRQVPYSQSPSLFYLAPRDSAFATAAWLGIILSCLALTGLSERYGTWFSMLVWALIWILYLSFVNVGQTFYGFGWESILLEAIFLAIFMGAANTTPRLIPLWLVRWLLFRIMFGAGLIKIRGDECWRNLTCLNWHYETQPMPNPLSWFFHWMPEWSHKGGVLFNHFAELIVPFGYFLPQPYASAAGIITVAFQFSIMITGNLSWLNLLTLILAFPLIDDKFWAWAIHLVTRFSVPATAPPLRLEMYLQFAVAALTVALSIPVVVNMLSARQLMNFNYNPLHLVGTYGAFGSVTRPRYEVVVEGTDAEPLTSSAQWREYEFKAKPTDLKRLPPQIAPYHLRLDWLMWFAALSSYQDQPWFLPFIARLLQGDQPTLSLLRSNPFPLHPPRYVRAQFYEYHFTTPAERGATGAWWKRQFAGTYLPPVSLNTPGFRRLLQEEGVLPE